MAKLTARKLYQVKPGDKLDLSKYDPSDISLFPDESKSTHEELFSSLTEELKELQKVLYAENKHRVLVVIQAMDTGGKDGCVKSVFATVDPQGVTVVPFKKPSERELSHDFLWRIHKRVPQNGQISIFNRSHYEDIIAVRVKDIYPEKVWEARHRHVVEFERMLAEEGTAIVKIFLNISKDEQKERLQARLDTPSKHWKFNPEDLADRARWEQFMSAYEDTLSRTSTKYAPWHIIPANRKWYRNLAVASLMKEVLSDLDMKFPACDWHPADQKID